jgi:hypothetical protein
MHKTWVCNPRDGVFYGLLWGPARNENRLDGLVPYRRASQVVRCTRHDISELASVVRKSYSSTTSPLSTLVLVSHKTRKE